MAETILKNQQRRGRGRPFQKGQSGNPAGKPRGCRSKAALLAEALLDGEAEKVVRKAIELALKGDVTALRIVLDRIVPPRRERPVGLGLPQMLEAADAATRHDSLAAHQWYAHITT